METDCKSADEEGVEGEERQVGLKRVAVVGDVQKVSTVPTEVSCQVKAARMKYCGLECDIECGFERD